MSVPTTDTATPAEGASPSTRRERVGWYFYDWANSAFSTTVISVFLGPYLTSIAENAAGCSGDACAAARVHVLGIPIAPRLAVRLRRVAVGAPAGHRVAGDGRDRRPVQPQEAAAGPARLHRLRGHDRPALPHRGPVPARGRRCSSSPTSPSAPASWCTTRSCHSWPTRIGATRCPASAGRSATSAVDCCCCSTWSPSSSAGTTWTRPRSRAGASSRPASGGRCSPRCPSLTLRNRPAVAGEARGSCPHRRLPPARAYPARTSSRTRSRCSS